MMCRLGLHISGRLFRLLAPEQSGQMDLLESTGLGEGLASTKGTAIRYLSICIFSLTCCKTVFGEEVDHEANKGVVVRDGITWRDEHSIYYCRYRLPLAIRLGTPSLNGSAGAE